MKPLAPEQIIAVAIEARHVAQPMPRPTAGREEPHEAAHAVVAQLPPETFSTPGVMP